MINIIFGAIFAVGTLFTYLSVKNLTSSTAGFFKILFAQNTYVFVAQAIVVVMGFVVVFIPFFKREFLGKKAKKINPTQLLAIVLLFLSVSIVGSFLGKKEPRVMGVGQEKNKKEFAILTTVKQALRIRKPLYPLI